MPPSNSFRVFRTGFLCLAYFHLGGGPKFWAWEICMDLSLRGEVIEVSE